MKRDSSAADWDDDATFPGYVPTEDLGDRTFGMHPFHALAARAPFARARTFAPPKNYTRTDERIREDVCEALIRLSRGSARVDVSDVEVRVKEGVVSFIGTVPDRRFRYAIEHAADGVAGVRDIENGVRVERGAEVGVGRAAGFESPATERDPEAHTIYEGLEGADGDMRQTVPDHSLEQMFQSGGFRSLRRLRQRFRS